MLKTKSNLVVKLPMTKAEFYKPSDWPSQQAKLNEIRAKYKKEIEQASKLCNIPVEIIECVIFLESAGNANAVSPAKAQGLMQLTITTATAVVNNEQKKGRLTDPEKAVLKKHLGTRLDCLLKMQYMNHKIACAPKGVVFTETDLKKPELNILLGTMLLGQLIDEHTEGNVVRLDKVIVRYNAGWSYKPQGKTVEETLAFAKSKGGAETHGYILKFVGATGVLTKRTVA